MRIFLLVLHLLLTLVMISVILIQRGEDANAGSSSGYGAMPGARSGKSLLTRVTSILAAIFFANCIGIAIKVRKDSKLGMVSMVTKETILPPKTAEKINQNSATSSDDPHVASNRIAESAPAESDRIAQASSAPVASVKSNAGQKK